MLPLMSHLKFTISEYKYRKYSFLQSRKLPLFAARLPEIQRIGWLRIRIVDCSCNSRLRGEPARSGQSSLFEGAWSRRSRRTSPLAVSWCGVRGANWQLPSCRRLIRHHRNRSSVEIEIASGYLDHGSPHGFDLRTNQPHAIILLGNLSSVSHCIVKQQTRHRE